MKHLITLFVLCLLPLPLQAGTFKDIAYGPVKGQRLDLYTPAIVGYDMPVMIFVHGGGWAIGDKKRVESKPEAFNNAGYIFISLNYPLVPDATVEEQAASVALAVKWAKDNIQKYNGNPKSIALMGHSAGAHLVALAGTDESYLKGAGLTFKDIEAVVPVDSGSMNVPQHMSMFSQRKRGRLTKMYNNAFGKDPTRWERLSPFHHIVEGRNYPPFLLLPEATRRDAVAQAKAFTEKLQTLGSTVQNHPVADRNHMTINRKFGEADDDAFATTLQFLQSLH